MTRAAKERDMPAVISFTVETDGRLPSGQPLGDAVEQVDEQTESGPAYYMTWAVATPHCGRSYRDSAC